MTNQKSLDKNKSKELDYSKLVEPIMTADNVIVGYKNVQNKPKSSEGKKDYLLNIKR